MYIIPNYLKEYEVGELLKKFIENLSISDEELSSITGIGNMLITDPSSVNDLSVLGTITLVELKTLLMRYMDLELFSKKCPDDEVDYCWNIGKTLIVLINETLRSKANSCDCGYARKKEE